MELWPSGGTRVTAGMVSGPRASAGGGHRRWSGAPGGPPYRLQILGT